MLKERQFYNEANSSICNRFYQRNLALSFGNLKLNIPRVRFGNNFRSCLLPQRWKRYDKDYEEFLLLYLVMDIQRQRYRKYVNLLVLLILKLQCRVLRS